MHDLSKKEECESFEGRSVNLAFYRESDTAGAKMSVSIFNNDFIYFVNTSIYLSVTMWYHCLLHRNWNQCNFMDHKKPLPDDIIVWHALQSSYSCSS